MSVQAAAPATSTQSSVENTTPNAEQGSTVSTLPAKTSDKEAAPVAPAAKAAPKRPVTSKAPVAGARRKVAPSKKTVVKATVAVAKSPSKALPKPRTTTVRAAPSVGTRKAVATKAVQSAVAKPPAAARKKLAAKKVIAAFPVKSTAAKKPLPTKQAVPPVQARKSPTPEAIIKAPKSSDKVSRLAKAADRKDKLVRDSFTMPQADYALIASLKDRALMFKRPAKKSELLRAGLHALQAMTAPALRAALDSLVPLKSGRPKREVQPD